MALIPYTKRVAQTRTSRPPRDGDNRRGRDDDQSREPQVAAVAVESTEVEETTADQEVEG